MKMSKNINYESIMYKKEKRIVVLNEFELKKTLSRLTFEIIEKINNLDDLLFVGVPHKRCSSRRSFKKRNVH